MLAGKGCFVLLACSLLSGAVRGADALVAAFADPPREVRPELWFHVIGGNISTNGLESDLALIAKSGFSGIQFFHEDFGGPWPGVTVQTRCLTENWDAYVRFAAEECRRRGLTFKMQNCPGWSMAGGPWIASTNAMRDLVFSRRLLASGGARPRLDLPREATDFDWRDYRDLRVLAFPSPDGDAAYVLRARIRGPHAPLARTACVDPASVLDLTDRLRADGTLDWTAPAGRWTVLRIGHVNAGHLVRRTARGRKETGLRTQNLGVCLSS